MPRKPITNNIESTPTIHERLRTNHSNFSMDIEDAVRRRKITYIEAILEFCEDNDIEIDRVKELVQGTLKSKLEAEAVQLHMMAGKSKLNL